MKKAVTISLTVLIIVLAVYKGNEFIQINNCMDSNGIWNYESDSCEFLNTHNLEKDNEITKIDISLLFNAWTMNPNGPHADFIISKDEFYLVDHEGNGTFNYHIQEDTISINYNPDLVPRGKIVKLTLDTLTINWLKYGTIDYFRWIN